MTATLTAGEWIAAVIAAVAVLGFVGTVPGRRVISSAFRGQSIQQIAAVDADKLVAAQAAYTMVKDMADHYKGALDEANAQIEALRQMVTGEAAIGRLTDALARHDTDTKAGLDAIAAKLDEATPDD